MREAKPMLARPDDFITSTNVEIAPGIHLMLVDGCWGLFNEKTRPVGEAARGMPITDFQAGCLFALRERSR